MTITAKQGNALNLKFKDESFDVALLFGPTYHLFTHEDKLKAINEAKRVLKKGGLLFIMYLTNEYAFITYAIKEGNLQNTMLEPLTRPAKCPAIFWLTGNPGCWIIPIP